MFCRNPSKKHTNRKKKPLEPIRSYGTWGTAWIKLEGDHSAWGFAGATHDHETAVPGQLTAS